MVSERIRCCRALLASLASVVAALPVVIFSSGTGCASGNGLRYTVDDALLQPLPTTEQQGVLEARKEAERAAGEREAAIRSLQEVDRATDAASHEKDQAQLEAERVVSEQEGARASGNKDQADMASHHKEVADLGVKVSKLKLDWLHQKRDWLEQTQDAADAHLGAARARAELEKRKAARDHDLKPQPQFAPSTFEEQWQDLEARWRDKKKSAAAEEKKTLLKQAKWQDEERRFRNLQSS